MANFGSEGIEDIVVLAGGGQEAGQPLPGGQSLPRVRGHGDVLQHERMDASSRLGAVRGPTRAP